MMAPHVEGRDERLLSPLTVERAGSLHAEPLDKFLLLLAGWLRVPAVCLKLRDPSPDGVPLQYARNQDWDWPAFLRLPALLPDEQLLVVSDTARHTRLAGLVSRQGLPQTRFVSVCPILTPAGRQLGSLWVGDQRPRRPRAAWIATFLHMAGFLARQLSERLVDVLPSEVQSLHASAEHRYRALFENATDVVFTHDLSGRITAINRAAERVTGFSREELLQMTLEELVTPSCRKLASQLVLEQLGGGASQRYELEIQTRTGKKVVLEVSAHLLFDHCQPVGLMGFGRDLTIQKQEVTAREQAELQLGNKSRELAVFSSHLKRLHRLSTAEYKNLDGLFADYLRAGCEIFGLPTGMLARVDGDRCLIRWLQPGQSRTPQFVELPVAETALHPLPQGREAFQRSHSAVAPCEAILRRQGAAFLLGAPIWAGEKFFGALCFASLHPRGGMMSSHEAEIVELMARSIGRAIFDEQDRADREHAGLLERERNQVLEMIAMHRPLEESLEAVVRMIERHQPELRGAVLLVGKGSLETAAAPRMPAGFSSAVESLPVSESCSCCGPDAGFCQRVLFLATASEVPAAAYRDLLRQERLAMLGCTPIRSASRQVLGFVAAYGGPEAAAVDCSSWLENASYLAAIALQNRQLTDQLAYQALHDSLTGLPNRRNLVQQLERAIGEARRKKTQLAVVFIDLDRFKPINDTLGHTVGDLLLERVGKRLKSRLRSGDILARVGGDEFTVMLEHLSGAEQAALMAQQLLDAIREPITLDNHELFVTASVGVSLFPQDGQESSELVSKADTAMYRVKFRGKNDLGFYATDGAAVRYLQLELESDLHRALEYGELSLLYQPQVEMNGRLDSLEVLLAWNHPKYGRMPARRFIPLAEETGMIVPIGAWVIQQACLQCAAWVGAGYRPTKVAVNVSALQFARPDFVETVAESLRQSGLDPRLLELELTESLVMRDIDESARRMARIRDLGVGISIDDFGTGYSSLSYLRCLPVDTLKIDKSFLHEIETSTSAVPMIRSIVSLAHNMGLSVVGEGVENEKQLALLREAGCDRAQGHLFGFPRTAKGVGRLLKHKGLRLPLRPR